VSVAFEPSRKRAFFECFPYVCPEPVLVKRKLLYISCSKSLFSYQPQAQPLHFLPPEKESEKKQYDATRDDKTLCP